MSVRLFHPLLVLSVAALVISGLLVQSTQAQGTQRSKRHLTAYETNTTEIFSDLNQLGKKDDGLRQLEEELNKSSSPFNLRRNLDSAEPLNPVPLVIPVVQTRRKKDALSHTDGWLSNPEELMSGSVGADYLGFPGMDSNSNDLKQGDLKQGDLKQGSWEEIYRRLKQDDSAGTGLGSSVKAAARQPDEDSQDDRDLPEGIKDNAAKLKLQLKQSDFGASIFSPKNTKPSFSDFFGVGATGLTPEQAKAHKAYMDTYMTTVFGDPSAAVGLNSSARESLAPAAKVPANSTPLTALPGIASSESPRPGSILNPTLSQSVIVDPNLNAVHMWDPLYSDPLPKLDSPKPQPFFTPPMEVPRRRF